MTNNPFGPDPFGFGKSKPKPEKGVQMRAKEIDGVRYVRLEDLCDLLKINDVLPGIETKFRKSL